MSKYAPDSNTLQSKFGFQDEDLKTPKHDEIMLWLDNHLENIISKLEDGEFYISHKIWEQPIVTGHNNFTIGFVDMYVIATDKNTLRDLGYCFEVKSSIPSLGEVIRQIRMYEQHCQSNPKFVVVSPDNRFEPALKSQGIGFVKYEP